jgi:hypothetical protein
MVIEKSWAVAGRRRYDEVEGVKMCRPVVFM